MLQTAVGLLAARHRVLVVADAVGSRTTANRDAALDRLVRHGAELVTTEMVLFEWLRDADPPPISRGAGPDQIVRSATNALACATYSP